MGALRGTVIGPARGTRLTVQIRRGGGWQRAGTVRTRGGGAYRWVVRSKGTYRVVVAGAAGPSVRF